MEKIDNIVDIEYPNPLIRIISGLYLPPSIVLTVLIYKLLYLQELSLHNLIVFSFYFLFALLLWFLREYNKLKYYITKIYIQDSKIYIQYFKWFKLIEINEEIIQVKIKFELLRSIKFQVFVNNKKEIIQFQHSFFMKSHWNKELMYEVEKKLKQYFKIDKWHL